jgi:hypothetical protein
VECLFTLVASTSAIPHSVSWFTCPLTI